MKTKTFQIRIEPDEIKEMRSRAKDLNMSGSEYVRYLLKLDQKNPGSIDGLILHAEEITKIVRQYVDRDLVKID